jgi:cell division cycle 20-like protein 1 (cofactor of APC complex)
VGSALSHIDTGSQVCSLLWARNCNEIVSAHGYSLNQIVAWNYPSMQPIATLCGHSSRVLYLAVSPCGQTILTGAADETLRFWNLFPSSDSNTAAATHGAPLKLPAHPDSLIR